MFKRAKTQAPAAQPTDAEIRDLILSGASIDAVRVTTSVQLGKVKISSTRRYPTK